MTKPLSKAMIRELRSMDLDGNPSDPYEWSHAPESLWFHTRNKVIDALLRRGLIIADCGYTLTDAGKQALAQHDPSHV